MKLREVIKRIEADGWIFAQYGGRSSHRIYKKAGQAVEIAISGVQAMMYRRVNFKASAESRGCR